MTSPDFVSRARNAEDVVLWRALGAGSDVRALELGAETDGFSRLGALAARGWTVLTADSDGTLPDDAPEAGSPVHVLAGGDLTATARALAALGERGIAPWVVVLVADAAAVDVPDYRHCHFDGVDHVLLHEDHAELEDLLAYPACSRDRYVTAAQRELEAQRDQARADAADWRRAALERWEEVAASSLGSRALQELHAMQNTVSWRVTKPLRAVRRLSPRSGR